MKWLALSLVVGGCCAAAAQPPARWILAQNSHFEVYTQTNDQTAQKALLWFEQMRAFFHEDGLPIAALNDRNRSPLRVVGFRSEREYAEFRIRPLASAYYASDGQRDYVIMASLQSSEFGIAAHEYSHFVLHAGGIKLPSCLREGIAEVSSTLRVTNNGYALGGDLPARRQTLRAAKKAWLPLNALLAVKEDAISSNGRKGAEIFYSESWALVDLLINSPSYSTHFRELVAAFNTGSNAPQAFSQAYGKSLDQVAIDLAKWNRESHSPRLLSGQPVSFDAIQISHLSVTQSQALLAEIALAGGQLEKARAAYRELAREQPDNPDFTAALGAIALRQGNRDESLKLWRRAIAQQVQDPELCYRYAVLAEDAGVDAQDIKAGLERAVLLSPGFDDARYKLALLESHAGEYQSAVDHLRKMAVPKDPRRYAYWVALTSALLELDQNEQAHAAALEASKAAQNENDRIAASRLAYMATTDLNVQFSTDSNGHPRMMTTRIPHGVTDWNPFIEPSDQIQRSNGKLSQVLCANGKLTGFLLLTTNGTITLDVADPSHVLMRNSPNEFFCGPTPGGEVRADYAVIKTAAGQTKNILRGMTFPK